MPEMKSKRPGWIDIKKSLKGFEHFQLVELLEDLFQLSEENKTFLYARCLMGNHGVDRYKKLISRCLYSDFFDENDNMDFDKAEKAITDYLKATKNDEGTADLMIYFVECGNRFTIDYGDINEQFYNGLIEMYKRAIETVRKLPVKKHTPFRRRLKAIMESADGIGWGYYDDLCNYYHEAFEQEK